MGPAQYLLGCIGEGRSASDAYTDALLHYAREPLLEAIADEDRLLLQSDLIRALKEDGVSCYKVTQWLLEIPLTIEMIVDHLRSASYSVERIEAAFEYEHPLHRREVARIISRA